MYLFYCQCLPSSTFNEQHVIHHTHWPLLAITHSVTNPSLNLITVPLLRKSVVCSPKTGSFVSSSSSFNFTWLSIERLINLFSLSTPLLMSEESLIFAPKAFVLYGYVAGFGSVNFRGGRGTMGAGFLLMAFNVSFRGSFSRTWNINNPVSIGLHSTTILHNRSLKDTVHITCLRNQYCFGKMPCTCWADTCKTALKFSTEPFTSQRCLLLVTPHRMKSFWYNYSKYNQNATNNTWQNHYHNHTDHIIIKNCDKFCKLLYSMFWKFCLLMSKREPNTPLSEWPSGYI